MFEGSVNGMKDRLMPIGFLPTEAASLAQAAYLPPEQQSVGSLQPIRPRPEISHVINHCVKALAGNHLGPKAHLTRVALWETVFGDDSWHEDIWYTPEDTAYKQTIKNLLSEPLVPGWNPSPQNPAAAQLPLLAPAPAPRMTAAVTTAAENRTSTSPGRKATIVAGVTSFLMASVNFLLLWGALLKADDPTSGIGYVGVLLILVATFALTGIGGVTACGITTKLARGMLLSFALVSAAGYMLVGISQMLLIDTLFFPALLNLLPTVLAAASAKAKP